MPRRDQYDAYPPLRAPLSFFDEDEMQPLGLTPEERRARAAAKRAAAATPSIMPAGDIKKRKPRNKKKTGPARVTPIAPGTLRPGSRRFVLSQVAGFKEMMKKHFKETHNIWDEHTTWPQHATLERIGDYIQKVKVDYIKPIWEQEGLNHKGKLEAIHSAKVDTTDYDFESIYKRVASFAEENGLQNRLVLKKPWAHEGKKPYVNVVLAWLFAAKKQLMYTMTAYLKQTKPEDPMASKFVRESEAGSAARAAFKQHKAELKQRAPRNPPFKDHALMEEQYQALHPHHPRINPEGG